MPWPRTRLPWRRFYCVREFGQPRETSKYSCLPNKSTQDGNKGGMEKILRTQNKGGLENPARLNQNKGGMENILRTAYPSLVLLNGKGEYPPSSGRGGTQPNLIQTNYVVPMQACTRGRDQPQEIYQTRRQGDHGA